MVNSKNEKGAQADSAELKADPNSELDLHADSGKEEMDLADWESVEVATFVAALESESLDEESDEVVDLDELGLTAETADLQLILSQEDSQTDGAEREDGEEENAPLAMADNGDAGELSAYESAEIEDQEFVESERVQSIIESLLFATDRPQSLASLKQAFKGTNVTTRHIKRALDALAVEYAGATRGVTLEEVSGGYQLRTKVDNMDYLKRLVKARTFRVSGPALEVLAIAAYKQPITKAEVDEIRGVESGHLMRGLMDRGLICFNGKSELPGKPMLYGTTKRFLEIFGLRNLKELPSLSEIDELIPEGIGDEVQEKETLADVTDNMSNAIQAGSYSEGEEELEKINYQLAEIETSSQFFAEEKQRERERRERERAQEIRERMTVGDEVETKDIRWLERYQQKLAEERAQSAAPSAEPVAETAVPEVTGVDEAQPGLVRETSGEDGPARELAPAIEEFSEVEIGERVFEETMREADPTQDDDTDFVASLVNEEGLDPFALAEIEAAVRAYEDERGVIPVDEVAEAKEFGSANQDLKGEDSK